MFALFHEFGARTRPQDLWPFLISETGLKFPIWTQGKIHQVTEAARSTGLIWRGPKYTQVSFSAKRKSKLYFQWTKLCLRYWHRLKTTSFKWTSHISWHCGPLHLKKEGSRMWFKVRGNFFFLNEVVSFVKFFWGLNHFFLFNFKGPELK